MKLILPLTDIASLEKVDAKRRGVLRPVLKIFLLSLILIMQSELSKPLFTLS